jgi:hypothetical protein
VITISLYGIHILLSTTLENKHLNVLIKYKMSLSFFARNSYRVRREIKSLLRFSHTSTTLNKFKQQRFKMARQQYQQWMFCFTILIFLEWKFDLVHGAAPLLEDNVAIRNDLPGRSDVSEFSWADSYSDGDSCYCSSSFDHDIGSVEVDTPLGAMSIRDVCELLGDGPTGSKDGRPLYNDIQCGNGPANSAGDEDDCPGRTEYGQEGCKYIGPKWNFAPYLPPPPAAAPVKPPRSLPVPRPIAKPVRPPQKPPVSRPIMKPVSPPQLPPAAVPLEVSEIPSSRPSTIPTNAPLSHVLAPLFMDFAGISKNITNGDTNVQISWTDSYSVGDECYCDSNFDHGIGDVIVPVPLSLNTRKGTNITTLSVQEICRLLGPGPGPNGRPLYNDIQCGNGPSNNNTSGDEVVCPGRTEYGAAGCNFLGPSWNWNTILRLNETVVIENESEEGASFLVRWQRNRM